MQSTLEQKDTIREEMEQDAQEILGSLVACNCAKPSRWGIYFKAICYVVITALIVSIAAAHQSYIKSTDAIIFQENVK